MKFYRATGSNPETLIIQESSRLNSQYDSPEGVSVALKEQQRQFPIQLIDLLYGRIFNFGDIFLFYYTYASRFPVFIAVSAVFIILQPAKQHYAACPGD